MDRPEDAERRAREAAEDWLRFAEKGDAGGSWHRASEAFRKAVTLYDWAGSLEKAQSGIGRPVGRALKSAEYKKELPGAPDGHYVVLIYDTEFQRKKHGVETVVPQLEADGEWRVGGYFVR